MSEARTIRDREGVKRADHRERDAKELGKGSDASGRYAGDDATELRDMPGVGADSRGGNAVESLHANRRRQYHSVKRLSDNARESGRCIPHYRR